MVNPSNKRPVPRVEWMLRLEPELAKAIDAAARRAGISRNLLIEQTMTNALTPPHWLKAFPADGLKAQDETPQPFRDEQKP
jgi:hypothetical protein